MDRYVQNYASGKKVHYFKDIKQIFQGRKYKIQPWQ